MCKINVLGTEYTIKIASVDEKPILEDVGGYTDSTVKTIVVLDPKFYLDDKYHVEDLEESHRRILRHEIIHAFLIESGLDGNGTDCDHWEVNDEMIDWFALQFPKILKAFEEADCI